MMSFKYLNGEERSMAMRSLSSARLERMHNVLADYVERGVVPGLVALVNRKGETHVETLGAMALGGSDPMRRDTIFRIASVTKPITAAATMILVEECKLRLDEPVDGLLPELANRQVLKRLDGPLDDTESANRSITVRDLLTFTAGYGLVMADFPIQHAIDELGLVGFGPPDVANPLTPDEWIERLGTLPLMHQPGEKWMYNTGSYILGVLIARASRQPLEAFLRERIFEPLGMQDTGFSVPSGKLDRFATSYWTDFETGRLDLFDAPEDSQWASPPAFPDGGGGLVSTADDLGAFGQMMLDKGVYDGRRILSRPSVELMTVEHLTPEQKAATDNLSMFLGNHGWGFGVAVVHERDDIASTPGKYGWSGGLGTNWAVDPAEQMITILLTQASFTSPSGPMIIEDFGTLAYQAIDD